MSHSAQLAAKIRLAQRLHPARHVLSQPLFDSFLPEYLFLTYCVARASVPLMSAALERARRLELDATTPSLVEYLAEHIVEEEHHADWLLDDLAALGIARDETLARLPPPSVAALVGAQYYWIDIEHPVSILAYMTVLEGTMPQASIIESLMRESRHPAPAFGMLLEHAKLDVEHSGHLAALLDSLPLSERQVALLGLSAQHTVEAMARLLNEASDR